MHADHAISVGLLALLCLCGAVLDWRARILPNWLCAVTALAGLGQAALVSPPAAPFYAFLAHGALALVGGMILFAMRWVGGGDAKLYAALACWFPLRQAVPLLVSVGLCGLILLIGWFIVRRLRGEMIVTRGGQSAKLPYGLAIAAGAFLTGIG